MIDNDLKQTRRALLERTASGFILGSALAGGTAAFTTPASAATITVPGDYSSIQDAVNAASPGDVIQVDQGSYGETVTVDKALTIRGDPGDTSTAGVGSNAPSTTEFDLGAASSGTSIFGFILDGSNSIDLDLGAGERVSDLSVGYNRMESAEIDLEMNGADAEMADVEFRWNRIQRQDIDLDAGYDGIVISNFHFVNNVFEGSSGDAVDLDVDSGVNHDVDFTINCNEIVNPGNDGIEFELDSDSSNTYDIIVYNNLIDGANDEGIEFLDNGGSGLTATIEYNDILNCSNGVDIRGDGDGSGIAILNNNISGNSGDGVDYGDSEILDARNNYWGASDGPSGAVTDPVTGATADGSGDSIDAPDSVRFDPFLSSAVSRPNDCTLNDPPMAAFTFDPSMPDAHQEVTLDASLSSDPDGSVVEYAWDFNGDGTFDKVTSSPTTTHSFSTTGTFEVRLVVTDDDGASSSPASQSISVGTEAVDTIFGQVGPPQDCDGDGLFEDVNGDGSVDSDDVAALNRILLQKRWLDQEPLTPEQQGMFDFADNGGSFSQADMDAFRALVESGFTCGDGGDGGDGGGNPIWPF